MVSIIIINYNDKKRIRRAINSALNQTYNDIEVIMVDDGSDKETREIYKEFSAIKVVQLERDDLQARTPSRARNAGIEASKGDYICVLDSDNYFASTYIEDLVKLNADVAYCNWEIVGKQEYKVNIEQVWDQGKSILENYLKHTHLDHQCILIKREYLDKCGHYDERLPRSQDCDLLVRLMLNDGKWAHCSKKLFTFEKHEDDQMKTIASLYGKTLWTLKNNINYTWLMGICSQSPYYLASFIKGIKDFTENKEWKEEFNNSQFKEMLLSHNEILTGEKQEVA